MIDFGQMLAEKKKKFEECDHLFIKTKEEHKRINLNTSEYEYVPCTVKCLKCGLTNFHLNMNADAKIKYNGLVRRVNPIKFYTLIVNDSVFEKQFVNNDFNLISEEVFEADNPEELYKQAKEINSCASNKELFNIMKKINNGEPLDEITHRLKK